MATVSRFRHFEVQDDGTVVMLRVSHIAASIKDGCPAFANRTIRMFTLWCEMTGRRTARIDHVVQRIGHEISYDSAGCISDTALYMAQRKRMVTFPVTPGMVVKAATLLKIPFSQDDAAAVIAKSETIYGRLKD